MRRRTYVTYDLSQFSTVSGGTGDTYTHDADTHLSGRTFSAAFPADTVQTFQIDNVVI